MNTKNASTSIANPFFASASFASNPFEKKDPTDVAADAPEGSYTYAMVPATPAVPAEECEVAISSVEVMVRWGSSVLRVAHLTPPRSFYVGEEGDVTVPADKLGATRIPLVLVDGGSVRLVLPATAKGKVTLSGAEARTIADLVAGGACQACPELAGAHTVALTSGTKAEITIDDFVFTVGAVNAGKKVKGFAFDASALPSQGISLLVHAGVLAAAAFFLPPMAMADEDGVNDQQIYALQTAIQSAAERDAKQLDEPSTTEAKKDDGPMGGTGAQAKGESGKMGTYASKNLNARYGIEGTSNAPQLSKQEALQQAREFGVIGLLGSIAGGPKSPTAPWGAEIAVGGDPKSGLGNMWGQTIDDAAGGGGLGLTGIGEGGGGKYEGIGLGPLGTIGHGSGNCTGDAANCQGFGNRGGRSSGWLASTHKTSAPRMTGSPVNVSGRLPPDAIQRVVRQNFGRFRVCYENGLRGNPSLQGRVAVRFVISQDGGVASAANGGSDMPDGGVVSCVTRAFYGLSFPAPEGGVVTVTYPIMFTPGAS